MVQVTSRFIDELKLIPRIMMIAITIMCFQVLGWAMSLEKLSLEQSGLCSVIFGCFSACFAVFLNKEQKSDRANNGASK